MLRIIVIHYTRIRRSYNLLSLHFKFLCDIIKVATFMHLVLPFRLKLFKFGPCCMLIFHAIINWLIRGVWNLVLVYYFVCCYYSFSLYSIQSFLYIICRILHILSAVIIPFHYILYNLYYISFVVFFLFFLLLLFRFIIFYTILSIYHLSYSSHFSTKVFRMDWVFYN
jgi:hypothetical protein